VKYSLLEMPIYRWTVYCVQDIVHEVCAFGTGLGSVVGCSENDALYCPLKWPN
jgi:hypothetical protein